MTNKKSPRHALTLSVISLLLCVAMLVGTTYAWFTDSVTSGNNRIVSGTLDVELEWLNNGTWEKVTEQTNVFKNGALWEPGYTETVYLKVSNQGNLALKYLLGVNVASESGSVNKAGAPFKLSEYIEYDVVEDVTVPYTSREEARKAAKDDKTTAPARLAANYNKSGALLPEAEKYVALVVYMPEEIGNEANYDKAYDAPVINLGVSVIATQMAAELDSFDETYDSGADFPAIDGVFKLTAAAGEVDAANKLIAPMSIGTSANAMSAQLPAGVELVPGVSELILEVKGISRSTNISMVQGEVSRSLDVHIEGVAESNTVPMIIDLGVVLPAGLKDTSLKIYHVEDGNPVAMDAVDSLTAHNQFVYDKETGALKLCLATFSEVTSVVAASNPWAGEIDTDWYNTTDTAFTIDTAEELAGLGAIVGGMAKDIDKDNFAGKTVTLNADLDLGGLSGKVWYPIGYTNGGKGYTRTPDIDVTSDLESFEGTFDGGNHTIANIYQNTWEMFGDYNNGYDGTPNYYKDGMGIFGFVMNGAVKNLVVNNFQSDGEFCTTGCVAAYAAGSSTFENITILNSNPRAYNVPNGGVVGYAYNEDGQTNVINFNNVNVNSSNKITALWGSWDVGCGGILGRVNGATTVNMTDCEVGAVIDVYNDVCANYQYYQYRYSGMLIGTVGADGDPKAGAETVNFSNVNVYIGNWADYYFCEFEKNSGASYTEDFQFSRVEKEDINFNNETNLPDFANQPCKHDHTDNEDKMGLYLPFSQLYTGYGWGASPVFEAAGVKIEKQFYSITYMDGNTVVGVEYQTAGERSDEKVWAEQYDNLMSYEKENFGGWVNVASESVTSVAAGNRNDVVLYATYEDKYTVRFLDEDGNVIHTQMVASGTRYSALAHPDNPDSQYSNMTFDHWEIRNDDGSYTTASDSYKITADTTFYPYYNYSTGEGSIGLEGHDTNGDGRYDYYTVEAVSGLSGEIEIPGVVNGVPVSVITDLSSNWNNGNITSVIIKDGVEEIGSGAFSGTSGLKEVTIPLSVTKVGSNAFSSYFGSWIGKAVTINYAGTWAQWQAVCDTNWDYGLGNGSMVICTDGTYKLSAGFADAEHTWSDWVKQ